jgi:biopolymer transport protein ExbD
MNLKGRNKVSAEFSMSSMTDIIFLLLLFFMLSATVITTNAIEIILPKAGAQTTKKQIIAITATTDGRYYIDKEQVSYSDIEPRLQEIAAAGGDNTTILIRGENTIELQKVTDLFELARRNGITPILGVQAPKKSRR